MSLSAGIYRIVNAQSFSSVRSYNPDSGFTVSSTREWPGDHQSFQVLKGANGQFTIKNVGLDKFAGGTTKEGSQVKPTADSVQYLIEPHGDNTYMIKVPGTNLVWAAKQPAIPQGEVIFEAFSGEQNQLFEFSPEQ